mmetsp:Transcript_50993/g.122025  ORF Transcript_50993/g.122025 Transcript_50993/m.122025 type:complete len:217 (-) Transcript_50993:5-655(-)
MGPEEALQAIRSQIASPKSHPISCVYLGISVESPNTLNIANHQELVGDDVAEVGKCCCHLVVCLRMASIVTVLHIVAGQVRLQTKRLFKFIHLDNRHWKECNAVRQPCMRAPLVELLCIALCDHLGHRLVVVHIWVQPTVRLYPLEDRIHFTAIFQQFPCVVDHSHATLTEWLWVQAYPHRLLLPAALLTVICELHSPVLPGLFRRHQESPGWVLL